MDAHIKDLTEHTYSAQLYDELWEYVEVIKGLSEYIALAPESAGMAYHNRGARSFHLPISSANSALTRTRIPWRSKEVKCRRFSVTTSRAPASRAISAMCAS